jgi:hypothetical protein
VSPTREDAEVAPDGTHDDGPLGDGAAVEGDGHDRRRLRGARRLALAGLVLGGVGAGAAFVAGYGGALGLLSVLLGATVGCVLAAAHLAVLAVADELRHRPVAARRLVEALLFFVGALLLLLLVMGAADAASGAAT